MAKNFIRDLFFPRRRPTPVGMVRYDEYEKNYMVIVSEKIVEDTEKQTIVHQYNCYKELIFEIFKVKKW